MRSVCTTLLLCFATLTGPSQAANPRDELLRLVPEDVGFCLVIHQARMQRQRLLDSPFAARFRDSALNKRILASPEWQQFYQSLREFEKQLGIRAEQLVDEILGEAVVLAYRPGPLNRPDEEQGLVLIHAREEKTLQTLLRRLNQLQQQTGDLKSVEECTHQGIKYLRRNEINTVNYYYLDGPVLLFSGQELLLKQALERLKRPAKESFWVRHLQQLQLDTAAVALCVNPRVWDTAIVGNQAADPAVQMAARLWKGLESLGLGLLIDDKAHLRVSFRIREIPLPETARRFFDLASKPNPLWAELPEEPLLAVAARFDLPAMYELIASSLTPSNRRAFDAELDRTLGAVLGVDVVRELLPAIGPDWAFWITAPPKESKHGLPSCFAALKVSNSSPRSLDQRGSEESVGEGLLSILTTTAQSAILAHNKKHPDSPARLTTTTWQGKRFRSIRGGAMFPDGIEPSFGLLNGYLIVASQLDNWPRSSKPLDPRSVPLVRASLKSWRELFQQRREQILQFLSEKEGIGQQQAGEKLEVLSMLVELLDSLELRQETSSRQAVFTLTLTPSLALSSPTTRNRPGNR